MSENLFANEKEKFILEELLAARKLEDIKKRRTVYEKEIQEALEKCGEILAKYGAKSNYAAEIYEIDKKLKEAGEIHAS